MKGLSEAVDPEKDEILGGDKNSDSGVVTEGDSEQSHPKKTSSSGEATINHIYLQTRFLNMTVSDFSGKVFTFFRRIFQGPQGRRYQLHSERNHHKRASGAF